MDTRTHPMTQEEVMALFDHELPAERKEFVSSHLDQCPECDALTSQFGAVSAALSRWGVEPLPGELTKRIMESAAKTRSGVKVRAPSIFIRAGLWGGKRWALGGGIAIATLLFLVAISVPSWHRSQDSTSKARMIAQHRISVDDAAVREGVIGGASKQSEPLSTPSRVVDSNGLLHGLGDHAQNTISVDGPLATEEPSEGTSGPMIARTASLSIVVKDFVVARATLDAILVRHHAYAAELTVNTAEGSARTLQASLRVPASELQSALSELKSLGRVENETQSGEEVTQQHADLVARLKNSRETEQRLQAILQERTGKITDVLQVEQEIARVRGEIEQMEAEQKGLEHRVSYVTVSLNLADVFQAQLTTPSPSIGTRFHNGFVAGVHNASEAVLGIALFFMEYGPTVLVLLLILGFPGLFLLRRYRRSLTTA
jgi:Domain of unknown function (DUF4349)/Putative zinc-finger